MRKKLLYISPSVKRGIEIYTQFRTFLKLVYFPVLFNRQGIAPLVQFRQQEDQHQDRCT